MKVLAFYNLKGGVGKTAAAVNVAWEAAGSGVPTLFWDLDPQAASSWYLQHDDGLQRSARKLIKGRRPVGAEVRRTSWPYLDLLPGDLGYRHMDLLIEQAGGQPDALAGLVRPFAEQYALLVLDCPPNFSRLSDNIFRVADLLAVPTIPTPLSLRAWNQLREHFKAEGLPRKRLIPFLSMVDRRRSLHRQWVDGEGSELKRQSAAWIPYASHVEQMGIARAPVATFAPRSPAAAAYRNLWHELSTRLQELPQRNHL